MDDLSLVYEQLTQDIEATTAALSRELSKLRTGRANIAILDGVRVSYYGQPTPLAQCAGLQVTDARTIVCRPWDRQLVSEIEKAIIKADLGIMPQNDGEVIRLPIPPLTQQRRQELGKQAKSRGEDAKIGLRNHRRVANERAKELEKDKKITQDEQKRALDKIQDLINRAISKVDEHISVKEKEIMEI
jgi:ribosome recycling factor